MTSTQRDISIPDDWDRSGLPGWAYHSEAFLKLEIDGMFRDHWQIACHVSDVAEPGSYIAFEAFGERALVMRGRDGVVRAFHNICRHRGSRVVAGDRGRCRNAIVCPFHGWVYNLDGTLRGAARPKSFPDLDREEFGLTQIETEIWMGFVFIRFREGPQPPVRELMAPFEREVAPYGIADMVPVSEIWTQSSPVNWKSVRDVDNEGYHVAMAHPALEDLYGPTYRDEPFVDGVCRSYATYENREGRRWSVRNYLGLAPDAEHLPQEQRKAWIFYTLFPNSVIAMTPELTQFYQEFPLSTGETLLRGGIYRYRDESREAAAARYLAMRIDRETMEEDVRLTVWSNESMSSPSFEGFLLSDLEYGVRTHHDHLRVLFPVLEHDEAPPEEKMAAFNDVLLGRASGSMTRF